MMDKTRVTKMNTFPPRFCPDWSSERAPADRQLLTMITRISDDITIMKAQLNALSNEVAG